MNKKFYKKWKLSEVLHPCKIVDGICKKAPDAPNRILIERFIKRGVAQSTASARVSRFKKLNNK